MNVTVCQLSEERGRFKTEWLGLVEHVLTQNSDLVLLPEMPFSPWFAATPKFEKATWERAVKDHAQAAPLLEQLRPAKIFGTMPINNGGKRINAGFLWDEGRFNFLHEKFYLPNEEPVWESNWYDRGNGRYATKTIEDWKVGFLICTELWFNERARIYGRQGADITLSPRKTAADSLEKWLTIGKVTAITSGAYSISSNSISAHGGHGFGGMGWVINPHGEVLGTTSLEQPFLTVRIDRKECLAAKSSYPRNVPE